MMASCARALACLAAFLLAGAATALAQSTEWTPGIGEPESVPARLILLHDELRGFVPTGQQLEVQRYGPLVVDIRQATHTQDSSTGQLQVVAPASVTVRYRNRLVAAATGYRLGVSFKYNGLVIESWDGATDCVFLRWKLEFAGERLELAESEEAAAQDCSG